jgi:hypothetical protein
MTYFPPAELAIRLFGGVVALARAVGRNPSSVSRWQKTGQIPTGCLKLVLDAAQREGIELSSEELVRGAEVELVESDR